MAVDYSRFQLGRDYSPLTQALQNGSNQFIQQMQFNQKLEADRQANELDAIYKMQVLGGKGQAKGQFDDRNTYVSRVDPKKTYRITNIVDRSGTEPSVKSIFIGSDGTTSYSPPEGGLDIFNQVEFGAQGKMNVDIDPENILALAEKASKLAIARKAGESIGSWQERVKAAETAGAISGATEGAKQEEKVKTASEMEAETGEGKAEAAVIDTYAIPYTKGIKLKANISQLGDLLEKTPQGKVQSLLGRLGAFVPGDNTFGEDEVQALNTFAVQVAGEDLRLNTGVQTERDFLNSLGKMMQQSNTKAANKLIKDRLLQNSEYDIKVYKDLRKWKADGNSPLDYEPITFEEFMGKKEPSNVTEKPTVKKLNWNDLQ